MNLQEMIDRIAKTYTFDEKSYPGRINGETPEQVLNFSLGHGLLHVMKSAGKIAAELEEADHTGGMVVEEELRERIFKLIVNSLRMAELVGMNAGDLEDMLEALEQANFRRRST